MYALFCNSHLFLVTEVVDAKDSDRLGSKYGSCVCFAGCWRTTINLNVPCVFRMLSSGAKPTMAFSVTFCLHCRLSFLALFIYLFNINLVQQYSRKEQKEKTHTQNYNKTTVKTKLYTVSRNYCRMLQNTKKHDILVWKHNQVLRILINCRANKFYLNYYCWRILVTHTWGVESSS